MGAKRISSRDNPLFKVLARLARSSRERRKARRCLVEGLHLVSAYQQNLGLPETLVVGESALEEPEIRRMIEGLAQVDRVILTDSLFRELSEVKTPSGILALVPIPSPARVFPGGGFCVLLEDLQDPGNLGSILRSAAAAGASAAHLSPGCADAWSPKVLRAGMGAHFALPIHEAAELTAVAEGFRGRLIATAPRAKQNLFSLDLSGPVGFIIGNEGAGVSPALLEKADAVAAIPLSKKMESLNAAAAAAVCFFEKVRQDEVRRGRQ